MEIEELRGKIDVKNKMLEDKNNAIADLKD